MSEKFIFVIGGVCSSLGKGIAAASLGTLLEGHGYRIAMLKIDPYINIDAGTMSPLQHGEVFVTDDGVETDLDLGNYSRFTNAKISGMNSITTGKIYQSVIEKERRGEYLGKCAQVIPHITGEICQRIYQVSVGSDITIIEIGGTVGDIESIPFLESCRQIVLEKGHQSAITVLLTLAPKVGGELKTKLTQHAVKELLAVGLQPDILLCRGPEPLGDKLKKKIALFTNVNENAVVSAYDEIGHIYRIPLNYRAEKLDELVINLLKIEKKKLNLTAWDQLEQNYQASKEEVHIAMVGKYVDLPDAYKSVDEALFHAGIAGKLRVHIHKIDAERIEKEEALWSSFKNIDAILVPGGFGSRGTEGMLQVARYAREHKIPFLGICLGMQIMVIEFARNVLGLKDANSTEFDASCREPVVSLIEEQSRINILGGSMRLGLSTINLLAGSKLAKAYDSLQVSEVHRHRYEVNNSYLEELKSSGLEISARYDSFDLVEGCEWSNHPWGIGMQAHPEFHSKPIGSHPLFRSFLDASHQFSQDRKSHL